MNKEHNSIFDKLKLRRECPLCSHNYETNRVTVLEEYNDNHLVHMSCSNCESAILHMVMINHLGMNSIGIITDLSALEVASLKRQPKISEDNLLEFHKFIQHPDNKFEQIIIKTPNI